MKVCILGSGALGSAVGGVLTEGGDDVWLIDAWASHIPIPSSLNAMKGEHRTLV
jgi:2-dehydropantoate 2-reductase